MPYSDNDKPWHTIFKKENSYRITRIHTPLKKKNLNSRKLHNMKCPCNVFKKQSLIETRAFIICSADKDFNLLIIFLLFSH